ncbi:MAG: alkaline phosphatase family protein [Pseudomonadales bacterium]|nr:alkaline phosphatase family protein [Pseudomonadales bacterium]
MKFSLKSGIRVIGVILGAALLSLSGSVIAAESAADASTGSMRNSATPALVVVVSIDQFRKDRLQEPVKAGLKTLTAAGRVFVDSVLDHGISNTCPGHAVILTGAQPARAGVAGNNFVDREHWRSSYCAESQQDEDTVFGSGKRRSPALLATDTLGDWMKAQNPASKVYSVAGKDRAAIMMGGQHPDGALWYNPDTASFTSSGYYMNALPEYVEALNRSEFSKVPATWQHPVGRYRPDDYEGESTDYKRVSGHPLHDDDAEEMGNQIHASPYVDDLTMLLARQVIDKESLGQDEVPDLLAIGLSANDIVGHMYGPFSSEAEATVQNIDRLLGDLLSYLDQKVGEGRYTLVLTADHGVADLPEWRNEQKASQCPDPSGRFNVVSTLISLYWDVYLKATFPLDLPTDLVAFSGSQIYINHDYVAAHELDITEVEHTLVNILESQAIVKKAWLIPELMAADTETARLLRNSWVEGRGGDIIIETHPDCILRPSSTGTTHGSHYLYDRDIPVIFYGAGVVPGNKQGPARSVDIGPTLAALLNVPMPEVRDGKALDLVGPAGSAEDVVEPDNE